MDTSPQVGRRSHFFFLGTAAILAVTAFLLTGLTLASSGGAGVSPIRLVTAVAVAVLLSRSTREWPILLAAFALGDLTADFVGVQPVSLSLVMTGANLLESVVCAFLLRRALGPEPDLSRGRDLWWFVGVAGVAAPLASGLTATALIAMQGRPVSLLLAGVWMIAGSIGLLTVTPFLLTLSKARQLLRERPLGPRGVASMVVLVAVTILVFGQTSVPLKFLIPPALMFVAFELEVLGGAVGTLMVAVVATALVNGNTPRRALDADDLLRALTLQLFFATNVLISLTVGSLYAQKRQSRRALERALAEAKEQARRALLAEEVASVGYWRLDAATYELHWSPEMCRIFGVPVSASPDLALARQFADPAVDLDRKARTARALATGEGWANVLTQVNRPDGEIRWVLGDGICERDANGRVTAVLGTVVDVTLQRALEEQLRKAQAKAEAAAAVKSEFLANMSHELRTPLTAVIGFTDLLERESGLSEHGRRYVGRVRSASKALLATVNDVLDFSKLEAGQVEIRPVAVSPSEVMRDVAAICWGEATAKGIDLLSEGEAPLPALVMADPDRLRQVLLNLVGNAVKFSERGRVRLLARYDRSRGELRFDVIDTGPGLSRRQLAGLFKRFSQVDASSTRRHGGTGLGLAICKGLVEAMGGEIRASSRRGEGSRFWFRVPAPVAEAGPTQALPAGVELLQDWRVLVVDDEPVTRELARAILEPAGAEVSEASCGREAVRMALEAPYDAILMDLRMPGLDGLAATERIRRGQGPNQSTPIIAFSAAAGGRRSDDLKALGFDGQVGKPVSAAALVDALSQCLEAW